MASACHCDIHASEVAKEANLPVVIRADKAYNDEVALLPLETVDGIYGNGLTEMAEEGIGGNHLSEEERLHTVWGDNADIDSVVEELLDADCLYAMAQLLDYRPGLRLIDTPEAVANELLREIVGDRG